MIKFIFGVVVGVFVAAGIYFFQKPALPHQYSVGRFLDEDIVYLNSGKIIRCLVVNEDINAILVETKDGSFSLPRSKCALIRKNAPMHYIRMSI